jgi:hypothetical protein
VEGNWWVQQGHYRGVVLSDARENPERWDISPSACRERWIREAMDAFGRIAVKVEWQPLSSFEFR